MLLFLCVYPQINKILFPGYCGTFCIPTAVQVREPLPSQVESCLYCPSPKSLLFLCQQVPELVFLHRGVSCQIHEGTVIKWQPEFQLLTVTYITSDQSNSTQFTSHYRKSAPKCSFIITWIHSTVHRHNLLEFHILHHLFCFYLHTIMEYPISHLQFLH